MDVTVKDVCGRCGKSEEKAVDAEKMIELLSEEQAKVTATEELVSVITDVDTSLTPDVVVMVKGTDGYMVETLDNLCKAPAGAKRRTGCYTRVMTLVEEIFLRKETKKKAPKTSPADAAPKAPANAPKAPGKKEGAKKEAKK